MSGGFAVAPFASMTKAEGERRQSRRWSSDGCCCATRRPCRALLPLRGCTSAGVAAPAPGHKRAGQIRDRPPAPGTPRGSCTHRLRAVTGESVKRRATARPPPSVGRVRLRRPAGRAGRCVPLCGSHRLGRLAFPAFTRQHPLGLFDRPTARPASAPAAPPRIVPVARSPRLSIERPSSPPAIAPTMVPVVPLLQRWLRLR